MRSRGSQLEVLLSPRLWADAGAPQNGRTKAGDKAWSQGLARDKAQVSLRKLHCASVPRAAAAVQTAGPSVCRLPSIAGSEAEQGRDQNRQVRSGKRNSRRPATGSHGELPGAEPRQCGGQQLGMSSRVAQEPDQESARAREGRHDATSPTTSWEVRSCKDQVQATPRTDTANQMSE